MANFFSSGWTFFTCYLPRAIHCHRPMKGLAELLAGRKWYCCLKGTCSSDDSQLLEAACFRRLPLNTQRPFPESSCEPRIQAFPLTSGLSDFPRTVSKDGELI